MSVFSDFFTAIGNFHEFLFYFFSVRSLVRTLFTPWKNIVAPQDSKDKLSFNLISRGIGFAMRFSLILFYVLVEMFYIVSLPFIFVLYLLFFPIFYFTRHSKNEEKEIKQKQKDFFMKSHLLDEKNFSIVDQWFDLLYEQQATRKNVFSKTNLFSIPPLARDWSMGYTPTLDEYAEDLTNTTYQSRITKITGREKEIDLIERTLIKSAEANALVVGEEGVGKHTIIDALAQKLYIGHTNSYLMYKRLMKLNMEKILSISSDNEKRLHILETLFEEAAEAKNVIIFIDDFEKYISYLGAIEKYAINSTIHFIGVTTPLEYERHIASNPTLVRLFTKIDVYEITKSEALHLVMANIKWFEERYKLAIPYETLKYLVEKSEYYVTTIPFPEKAIDLLDQACVLSNQEKNNSLLQETVDKVITEKSHVPTTITDNLKEKLLALQTKLLSSVIGQNEAIIKVGHALERAFLLWGKRKNPIARLLLLGPTGVGKTETAKIIASSLFENPQNFIRFDMSAYQQKSDIPHLLGSVETGQPGLLISAVREHPFAVLLLDEIEKADSDLRNIFLTMLDEGYITDSMGKRTDCKNMIIIATSNAGREAKGDLLNFLIENHTFSPEFLNRFDAVIEYKKLESSEVQQIAEKLVNEVIKEVQSSYNITVRVNPEFISTISAKEYNPEFGVRDMERHIRQKIEEKVATVVFEKKAGQGQTLVI